MMSSSSRDRSAAKEYQIEERFAPNDNLLDEMTAILDEATTQISDFNKVRHKDHQWRDKRHILKKRLKLSFNSEHEMHEIKQNSDYRINLRNILGVMKEDTWVNHLNIGNVMNIQPLEFDDLYNRLVMDELDSKVQQEISRDQVLEKLILLAVSYFCAGTEIRFGL